jgi:hypothetical protein
MCERFESGVERLLRRWLLGIVRILLETGATGSFVIVRTRGREVVYVMATVATILLWAELCRST